MAIIVPAEIEVDEAVLESTAITALTSVTLTRQIIPTWDEDLRTISIDNAFDEAFSAPAQVRFIIEAGLRNSYSSDPITPITVQTLDPDGEIIDEGSSEAIEYTANEITAIEATACADKQTASTTEEICTYRLKFLMGA